MLHSVQLRTELNALFTLVFFVLKINGKINIEFRRFMAMVHGAVSIECGMHAGCDAFNLFPSL